MEQRKEIVNQYVHQGLTVPKAVNIVGISKSTFYYKPNGRKRGKAASKYTLRNGERVPNEKVVELIEEMLGQEFIDYGYIRTAKVLRKNSFVINPKKVYRLMNEKKLLQTQIKGKNRTPRNFVRYSCPEYKSPFATVEIDIKYLYLAEERRNCYLLTALDTFTRTVLAWDLAFSMKHERVISLIEEIKRHDLVQPYLGKIMIRIRTDNGPQFIAHDLRNQIAAMGLDHEFIHPATPQQNGHIESFHSTLQKLVVDQYDLNTIDEAKGILEQFYYTYNNARVMEAIVYCAPVEFLRQWEKGKIEIREKNKKQKFFFRERQVLSDTALSREDSL